MNRELLERPFAPDQIKRRQGMNGDVLDYIEGCAVIQRLNECFDAEWVFEIQEHRVYDDEVVVLGKPSTILPDRVEASRLAPRSGHHRVSYCHAE